MQAFKAYIWPRVLQQLISQHFIEIYFTPKFMQFYICPPRVRHYVQRVY